MDLTSVTSLLANSKALAASRWRQLAAAIGVTALLGAVLWFLLIKVAGSVGGDASSGGMPSRGGIMMSLTISWAILVSAFVTPMAASTAAIADDEGDDSPLGWTGTALRSVPWMWVRLAIPTLPLLLLGMWALNDMFSAFADLAASLDSAAAGGAPKEPGKPLSFRLAELLFGSAPARWAVFATVLGLWYMWSATRATGQDDRAMPHAPWRLFGRSPLLVVGLAGISAVALGPLLNKALSSLGGGLESVMGGGTSSDGGSTMAVLIVGMVISAFIGIVAIPWIALFREDDGFVVDSDQTVGLDPTYVADSASGADPALASEVAGSIASAPASAMSAGPQVVDQTHVAASGTAAGAWWFLQAGAQVGVQVAAAPGVAVSPVASDATGAWLGMHETGQPGGAALVVQAAGWYLLGAWNSSPQDAQVAMRFTLPPDAQAAPAQQAAG